MQDAGVIRGARQPTRLEPRGGQGKECFGQGWMQLSAMDSKRYPFGYDDEELRRLGVQHRVWQDENQRLLSRAGFGLGDTLVDLGCGPGHTTLDLARMVGPRGRIIGVDRDAERSIPRLQAAADAAGLGNVEAIEADLEHFDLFAEALMRTAAGERGGNPEIGSALPGVLHGAGLEVELGVATKAVRSATDDWLWPDTLFRQILPLLVEKGHLDAKCRDEFLTQWEERSRDPWANFFSSPVLEVIGRRPGG